jgi:hypothetical protein
MDPSTSIVSSRGALGRSAGQTPRSTKIKPFSVSTNHHTHTFTNSINTMTHFYFSLFSPQTKTHAPLAAPGCAANKSKRLMCSSCSCIKSKSLVFCSCSCIKSQRLVFCSCICCVQRVALMHKRSTISMLLHDSDSSSDCENDAPPKQLMHQHFSGRAAALSCIDNPPPHPPRLPSSSTPQPTSRATPASVPPHPISLQSLVPTPTSAAPAASVQVGGAGAGAQAPAVSPTAGVTSPTLNGMARARAYAHGALADAAAQVAAATRPSFSRRFAPPYPFPSSYIIFNHSEPVHYKHPKPVH